MPSPVRKKVGRKRPTLPTQANARAVAAVAKTSPARPAAAKKKKK